jgi:vitamin B12 transporter
VRGELSLTSTDVENLDDDRADSSADTIGFYYYDALTKVRRRAADARMHFSPNASSVLTIGGELVREDQSGNDSSNYSFERSNFEENRRNSAVYAQWLSEHGRLSITAGARYDDNSTFGAFNTARAGIAFRAWEGGTLRFTAGTAFKAPTFFESFNTAFSTGNADLDPERSRSWEAGVRHNAGRVSVAASWFDQRFRDMIQYAFLSPEQPNYFNVAVATARGLELEATARLSSAIRLGATTTFLRTRVEDAGLQSGDDATFVEGNRLLRRPGVMSTVSMEYDVTGNTTGGLFLTWTGERDDRDFATFPATPVVLPAWTRIDVAITQRLGQWTGGQFELMARVENLLGAEYEEIVNYRAAGRSLTIGLRAARLRR